MVERGNSQVVDNLFQKLVDSLPADAYALVQKAAFAAEKNHQSLYLVGGAVRDLLLGKASLDIDLVLEGDAPALAREIQPDHSRLIVHSAFGTATLAVTNIAIDFVTARRETYPKPGALPVVEPATISEDLFRRDFTVNAMAIALSGANKGCMVDPWGGTEDLKKSAVRVLHNKSFIDDATRILRAIRYEQRLGFNIEKKTESLLRRDIPMLDTIGGERIRHEMERIFLEARPELALERGEALGVWHRIDAALVAGPWLRKTFDRARAFGTPVPVSLYYALFLYRLDEADATRVLRRLSAFKATAKVVIDAANLKQMSARLASPDIKPSGLYAELRDFSPQAIVANLVAGEDAGLERNLRLYLDKLRYVRPNLRGSHLVQMGAKPGPDLGEILSSLHRAKLDGDVSTKAEEAKLARRLIGKKPVSPRRRRGKI